MEINTQIVKEFFYKFFIVGRGHSSFMLKTNEKVFLELIDFRKCQEYILQVLINN